MSMSYGGQSYGGQSMMGGGQSMSSSTRSVQLRKSSSSDFKFEGCSSEGDRVTITYSGSKQLSIGKWKLIKELESVQREYEFPSDFMANPGQRITIVANEAKKTLKRDELLADSVTSWGYLGTFYMRDNNNKEKCNMKVTIT